MAFTESVTDSAVPGRQQKLVAALKARHETKQSANILFSKRHSNPEFLAAHEARMNAEKEFAALICIRRSKTEQGQIKGEKEFTPLRFIGRLATTKGIAAIAPAVLLKRRNFNSVEDGLNEGEDRRKRQKLERDGLPSKIATPLHLSAPTSTSADSPMPPRNFVTAYATHNHPQQDEAMLQISFPMSRLHALDEKIGFGKATQDRKYIFGGPDAMKNLTKDELAQLSLMARKFITDIHEEERERYHQSASTKLEKNRKAVVKSRFISIMFPFPKADIKITDKHYISSDKGNIENKYRYMFVRNKGGRDEWGSGHPLFTFDGTGTKGQTEIVRSGYVPVVSAAQWREEKGDEIPINVILVEGRKVLQNTYLQLRPVKFHWKSSISCSTGIIAPASLAVLNKLVEQDEDAFLDPDFEIELPDDVKNGLLKFMDEKKEWNRTFKERVKPWQESETYIHSGESPAEGKTTGALSAVKSLFESSISTAPLMPMTSSAMQSTTPIKLDKRGLKTRLQEIDMNSIPAKHPTTSTPDDMTLEEILASSIVSDDRDSEASPLRS